jgi:hypothetical protein
MHYRPEDIKRQMVIESYGYRVLRINRFTLCEDPVATLSTRPQQDAVGLPALSKCGRSYSDHKKSTIRSSGSCNLSHFTHLLLKVVT